MLGATTRPAKETRAVEFDWLHHASAGAMRAGSIAVHAPVDALQAPGGGEVQLVETCRALSSLGLSIRPFVPWTDQIADARLLHLFGMSREGLALARVAKAKGVPVVVSPICWIEPAAFRALSRDARAWVRSWASWSIRQACPQAPHWRRDLMQTADFILPNSEREARQLSRAFAIPLTKFRAVPNGVDARFAHADAEPFQRRYDVENFVLFVGRIEPRKNLDALIRAVRGRHYPLVVIGDQVPGHEAYARRCRALGGDDVRWLPRLDHHDPMLASAYAAARVFALPSWFETPGLAALEAALSGCPIVITPLGCTREYFGTDAEYAHPARVAEICSAIERAWDVVRRPDLARKIKSRYLWSDVARKTAEVYDDLDR